MRRPCGARQSIHLDLRAGREGGRTLSERVGKHGKVFLEECTESMGKEERGKRKEEKENDGEFLFGNSGLLGSPWYSRKPHSIDFLCNAHPRPTLFSKTTKTMNTLFIRLSQNAHVPRYRDCTSFPVSCPRISPVSSVQNC